MQNFSWSVACTCSLWTAWEVNFNAWNIITRIYSKRIYQRRHLAIHKRSVLYTRLSPHESMASYQLIIIIPNSIYHAYIKLTF